MRLLVTWLQMRPAADVITVGAAQAIDAQNFDTGRRWDPDMAIDRISLDARMAKNPPTSIGALLELVCAEVAEDVGYHVNVLEQRPKEEPPPPPAEDEVQKITARASITDVAAADPPPAPARPAGQI